MKLIIQLFYLAYFLLFTNSICFSEQNVLTDIKKLSGVWEFFKYENPHNHKKSYCIKLIKESLGKKVVFAQDYFICSENNAFYSKGTYKNVSYKMIVTKFKNIDGHLQDPIEGDDKGTLEWDDLPGSYDDRIVRLKIVEGKNEHFVEVDKFGDLVVYCDDVFCYLHKIQEKK